MSGRPRRIRVAVLGGGAGGLTAAFELTATPELRARYDVTVYQLGWRLGGKGASGRNAALGQRIEEHGLHLWFGFYDNAFSLMQRCYEELGRPPGAPLATWDEAFFPCNEIVLYEEWGDRWIARDFTIPENRLTPGEHHPLSFAELVGDALGLLRREWMRLSNRRSFAAPRRPGRAQLLDLAHRRARSPFRHLPSFGLDVAIPLLLDGFRDWLWEAVVEDRVDDDDVRFFFMAFDFVAGIISGIYRDRLLQRGFGVVNDEELSAWLERHGVTRLTLEHFPVLRGFYSLVFGFEEGDTTRPNVAAGKAIQALIRIAAAYKGSVLWKMRAGMGDTVFAPLYEVLRHRGVRFRFFHAVTDLGLSPDRTAVSTIVVQPQVELAGGGEYRPLVDVRGLPCWPNEPDWSQLAGGEGLRRERVDFETVVDPMKLPPVALRRGRQFDVAVLAIPVGALLPICTELAADPANPRFGRMLANAHTVATQAFQLWMNRPVEDLGWAAGPNTALSSYVEPLDTYCDMAHLIPAEDWRGDQVAAVAYFCGVLPDGVAAGGPEAARVAARAVAVGYLDDSVGRLWPGATAPDGGFEWKLLADPRDRSGEARFDSQYWRANVSGTERYVTTPAGSVAHRLWADESGYENLVLAGDWTRNGIDGGCVEAAVTSGMQAARAICGEPSVIPGEDGVLERD